MSQGQNAPLIFYDISSPLQPRSFAPNPTKTRLALSFKGVDFTSEWVDILDIARVRQELKCPARRKFDDGSDFYTLPMLRDPATGQVLGDSFDIAAYLDDRFPSHGGSLFPADSSGTGLDYQTPAKGMAFHAPLTTHPNAKHRAYAEFNTQIDATFTTHFALASENLPFNPATANEVKALFAKRAHVPSWDALAVPSEKRPELLANFKEALTSLAKLLMINGHGPYLEGDRATYADLIIGGWLNTFSITMPAEEWEMVRSWHSGVFARLHDALQKNYFRCT